MSTLFEDDDEIEAEALRLFRLHHGPGDSGSESAYNAQNPARKRGWERLAVEFLTLKLYAASQMPSIDSLEPHETT